MRWWSGSRPAGACLAMVRSPRVRTGSVHWPYGPAKLYVDQSQARKLSQDGLEGIAFCLGRFCTCTRAAAGSLSTRCAPDSPVGVREVADQTGLHALQHRAVPPGRARGRGPGHPGAPGPDRAGLGEHGLPGGGGRRCHGAAAVPAAGRDAHQPDRGNAARAGQGCRRGRPGSGAATSPNSLSPISGWVLEAIERLVATLEEIGFAPEDGADGTRMSRGFGSARSARWRKPTRIATSYVLHLGHAGRA